MKENLQKFRCGGCGNDSYRVYQQEGNIQQLFSECIKCKSITIIEVTKPKIDLKWDDGADGIMCVY